MAQDITLLGANYSAVPAVELPKTGGGTASFTDISDTTAVAADVAQGKYFYDSAGVRTEGTASGGGGIDLSWIASNTPNPNVKNFFYSLINGNTEHGEFTRANTDNTQFTTLFTMTRFSETTPPRGFLFIDKNYERGVYPSTNSEAVTFMWIDKTFLNTATLALEGNNYVGFKCIAMQTGTAGNNMLNYGVIKFDGSTSAWRAKYQLSGNNFQIKDEYSNNDRYVLFRRNRTYTWIVY